MSAAKMVADSTQGDVPDMSSTKKRKKIVHKKKVKKKKEFAKKNKRKIQQEAEFDDSDLDLDKEIHPIGYYVKDRDNLLSQMFHCVKGQSLSRALPDVLKELPFEDLRKRCMEQLEVMSKKRIRRILAGDDPASISSSSTEDETSEEDIVEIEEGQVDEEGEDSQVVDSTSFTLEVGDSDREVDDGSVINSSPYGNHSEGEYDNMQQDDDTYEPDDMSDQDVVMETVIDKNRPESCPSYPPGTPEEPEEGEVIDDNSESEEVNPEKTDIKKVTEPADITEENSVSYSLKEGDSDTKTPVNQTETSVEKVECESVEMNAEIADESVSNNKSDEDSKLITVDNKIDNSNNIKDTDKRNETASNAGYDVRIVKKEIKGTDDENTAVVTDIKDETKSNEHVDDVIKLDDNDDEIEECTPNVSDKDLSDEGEILEVNAKKEVDAAVAECSTSEVIVSEVKKGKPARRVVKPPKQDIAPALTRNQMELLELEMRARAIKAMLKTAK